MPLNYTLKMIKMATFVLHFATIKKLIKYQKKKDPVLLGDSSA